MRRRRPITTIIAATCLILTAACSHSDVPTQRGPSLAPHQTPSASAPSPTATIDPRAAPAVTAYQNFQQAADQAQRHPVLPGSVRPPGADFTKYSFDPIRTAYEGYIASLNAQQVQYRGTPNVLHITVKSIKLNEKPWPTVILTDCQTGHRWAEYVIKTGRRVPPANGKVPPPYLLTAKMIFYEGHWGLMSNTADKSRTCTA